jgi:hypothetical protein
VIDAAGETVLEGGTADIGRLISATEQLTKLLPKTVEPVSHRPDPREALLQLILEQRRCAGIPDSGVDERDDELAELKAEVEQLRAVAMAAGLAVPHASCGTPPEADVTPPSEIGEFYRGAPRPGPDDRTPVTIEGKAEPADDGAVDIRGGFSSDNSDQSWRNFATDTDGVPLTARGRRYWGPV